MTLVEVDLETGRYNQIRLHFAAIGCPLLGERKYARGSAGAVRFRRPRAARNAHRVRTIRAHAPADRVEAPLPADFEGLLAQLRRH